MKITLAQQQDLKTILDWFRVRREITFGGVTLEGVVDDEAHVFGRIFKKDDSVSGFVAFGEHESRPYPFQGIPASYDEIVTILKK